MGYMGFGMQKWIYNMKPRKAFQKRRRAVGDTIDVYKSHTSVYEKSPEERKSKRLFRYKEAEHKSGNIYLRLLKFLIPTFIIIYGGFKMFDSITRNDNAQPTSEEIKHSNKDIRTYNYLVRNGYIFIHNNEPEKAIKEFEYALSLIPGDQYALYGFAKARAMNCANNNSECGLALYHLDKMIKMMPDSLELYKLRSKIHLKMGNTGKAIKDMERINR